MLFKPSHKVVEVKDFNLNSLAKEVSKLSYPLILGGNKSSRYSYFCFEPIEVLNSSGIENGNVLNQLDKALKKYSIKDVEKFKGIFHGGWAGYFSYDLGYCFENIKKTVSDDLLMPLMHLAFYDKAIIHDRDEKCFYLISHTQTPKDLNRLQDILKSSQHLEPHDYPPAVMDIEPDTLKSNMSKSEYINSIEKIKKYIHDGDVYQINFSQRFDTSFPAEAVDLFNWQNIHNPSPYSAYMKFDDFEIVSTSPELFIQIDGNTIITKPIKGTRKFSTGCDDINRKNLHDLITCEKEQAELNMIIDLERNDIAHICIPGTRKVTQPRYIEQFPTVYHAMATIEGNLRPDIHFSDILRATFPGGSITGAPKIRSMQIIDELEPTARGLYTGSIGYITSPENACLNIAIRTVIIKDKRACFQVGGGIVADSDPEFEWQETLTKAVAMAAGINALKG